MGTPETIIDLTVEDVVAGLEDGTMVVVDVREPQELLAGMIPGSISMPLSSFDPTALPVDAGRRIVFSCAAGVRSRMAIDAARRAGLDVGEHLASGFKGWAARGGTVVFPE